MLASEDGTFPVDVIGLRRRSALYALVTFIGLAAITVTFIWSYVRLEKAITTISSLEAQNPAAPICAWLTTQHESEQSTKQFKDLSVQVNTNGVVTLQRNGNYLGKIEKGTYEQYVSCLVTILPLIVVAPNIQPPSTPRGTQTFKICTGNGGGPSCISGSTGYYTCAQYSAIGGGGQSTYDILGRRFCAYMEGGKPKVAPYKVIAAPSRSGGECGWTEFTVTCNPP